MPANDHSLFALRIVSRYRFVENQLKILRTTKLNSRLFWWNFYSDFFVVYENFVFICGHPFSFHSFFPHIDRKKVSNLLREKSNSTKQIPGINVVVYVPKTETYQLISQTREIVDIRQKKSRCFFLDEVLPSNQPIQRANFIGEYSIIEKKNFVD